jgi:acyl-CoA synthetase (AMP-forming)/AMP-acid ligase II
VILWNYICATATTAPERVFVVNGGDGLGTYGAAARLIAALGSRLASDSERRASVGVVIRDSRLLLAFLNAAGVAGRMIHVLHPDNIADVLVQLGNDAECDAWYVEDGVLDFNFAPVNAATTVIQSPTRGSLDDSWQELGLSTLTPAELPSAGLAWDAAHTVLYTSGTMGLPKGVMLPYRYGAFWGEVTARELKLGPTDILYCPLPLYHNMGLNFTSSVAIVAGCAIYLRDRFSASHFWKELEASRATAFPYLGAMLGIIEKHGVPPQEAVARLRYAYGAGATAQSRAFFHDRLGVDLLELYGMTEIGVPLLTAAKDGARASIGRLIPEYDVEIQDDHGAQVADNEIGEIVVGPRRPGTVLKGYWGKAAAAWSSTRDFWWRTGDLASRDAAGWYHFAGRSKDVIRRRGENVPAVWIEDALGTLPDVVECAAIGVPSPLGEEEIKVFIVDRGDDSARSAQALIDHCSRSLPAFAVPDELEFVRELPKTPTEKVKKAELRRLRTLGGVIVRRDARQGPQG